MRLGRQVSLDQRHIVFLMDVAFMPPFVSVVYEIFKFDGIEFVFSFLVCMS